jgi:hypothetical protein
MRTYSFTIFGNHEDGSGNPLPKIRKTYRQRWSDEAQRYAKWKAHVQDSFLKSLVGIDYPTHVRVMTTCKKPIHLYTEEKAVMNINIHWRDKHHGDPENIFGSIADALFFNDKELDGSFKSDMSKNERASVEVEIIINDVSEHE